MESLLTYDGIRKYWQDDYYFCEDKILANVSNYFRLGHELMFAGGFNFGYDKDPGKDQRIGDRITVTYFKERELLEKYYGVVETTYDLSFGGAAFLQVCKDELRRGKPVSVGLHNDDIWPVKPGEEEIRLLPFLVIGVDDEDNITIIDSHELGIIRTIPRDVFILGYRFGATFQQREQQNDCIDLNEFIQDILRWYDGTIVSKHGCVDIELSFSSLQKEVYKRSLHNTGKSPYEAMCGLAEDVLSMDFEKEIGNQEGVLWVPFYFDLLLLYRSRLTFTKALREVERRNHTDIFGEIIKRLVVISSKWNYLRMVFTNCYHNREMHKQTKEMMSAVIYEIAELEKQIIEEFKEIATRTYDKLELSDYYNTYLFDHENCWRIGEDKAIYGRYYYKGETVPVENANEKGDSLVCLGQTIELDKMRQNKAYRKILLWGSVLYNEMIYDYMKVTYTDGSVDSICIGFDGWIKNEYRLDDVAKPIWEGEVVKSENHRETDSRRIAIIYEKSYQLSKNGGIKNIILPNNPFINLIGIKLQEDREREKNE